MALIGSVIPVAGVVTAGASTSNDTTEFSVNAGSLAFSVNPNIPTMSSVTLNGSAQTTNATMNDFGVTDATGSGSGWNVTVNGNSGGGSSAVFKQYCSNGGSACGGDPANSYVAAGYTLSANSLTLNSTSATFTPGTDAPAFQCDSACNVDSAAPVKIVSAAAGKGMGTFTTGSWPGTSLALSTPSTLHALPANEVYRVDLVWTLTSGP